MHEIQLPELATHRNIELLAKILSDAIEAHCDVELDCSRLTYIEPLAIAMLAAAVSKITANHTVHMTWLSTSVTSYLQRMNFFNLVDVQGVDLDHGRMRYDQSGSLCELINLSDEREAEAAVSPLASAIVGRANNATTDGVDAEFDSYFRPLSYALHELVLNSLTHAKREGRGDASVWIAAQYYKNGFVKAAVVDDGCGFLSTLQNILPHPPSHVNAVKEALKARVSCNRHLFGTSLSENQGIGLTVTSRIVNRTQGDFYILSGNAIYKNIALDEVTKRRDRTSEVNSNWQGVAIGFSMQRDQLPYISIPDLLPDDELTTTETFSPSEVVFL